MRIHFFLSTVTEPGYYVQYHELVSLPVIHIYPRKRRGFVILIWLISASIWSTISVQKFCYAFNKKFCLKFQILKTLKVMIISNDVIVNLQNLVKNMKLSLEKNYLWTSRMYIEDPDMYLLRPSCQTLSPQSACCDFLI